MSNQDRLTADLALTGLHPIEESFDDAAADLIARGWTRLGCEGCGDSITGDAWHYGCAATDDLDEERLARALINARTNVYASPHVMASAIAKAYREDREYPIGDPNPPYGPSVTGGNAWNKCPICGRPLTTDQTGHFHSQETVDAAYREEGG